MPAGPLDNLEEAIRKLQDLYDDPDIVIPASQLPEKENPYKAFEDRNPMAGGGMLVKPGFGGTRQGYAGDKSLKPGEKKTIGIGKEPGIFKISTRASDKIKYVISYTDNDGNRKKFMSTESFKNITEAKKARNKKITSLEKELNIPEGKLLDETYTTRRKNIMLLPKNKKNYITLTELRNLLGPGSEDMRAMGGSKDTVVARASAKLLDQTKITTKDGANYFFYKKPTDKQLNLLKTYIDARPIRKDMFERIQNLQKDKYTAKIVKDGKLPMNADGVLDKKFLKHVSDNYETLDKYVHGLVRYTQALDGQTIIGLNDPILSDGKFKTNKKLASNIVNTFLETPRGSSNASQNTIRKAVYKAAMNDITNELGNTETTFENFKNQIRQKINNDFKLKGKGIEIDELIGVSTSFRNKTAPYAVFTQFVDKQLNQGILKDYQKVVSNYTAQLKNEINKNSKFVNGKWQHSKKAKDIVNNFNTNIIPNLKNIDQLKGTNVSLPELTLGSPTDKTLGGTKGRLNQLENMGLNFREFYRQEGFGYKMPEGVVTQKEILDVKKGSPLYKKLMKFCPTKNGGEAGVCTLEEAMDGLVSESKQLKSGNMNEAQAKRTAQKIRAVTRVGTGSTLMGLLGPYGVAGEVVIDGAFMANNMLDGGDTYKEALSKSLIKYAMPKDARERLEKETDLNTMILGSDTKGLAADYVDALKKNEDLQQKYQNYLKVNQEDTSSLQDPYSSGTNPMFSTGDKNRALRELMEALERSDPTYGKNIYDVMKFGSPEQQAFAAKQEVFDAEKMQRRMDYDRKILGPLKDLFGTGFYSPEQLKQLELKADRDTKAIGESQYGMPPSQSSALQRFGDVAQLGVANLAKGGRAGYKTGSVRKGVLSLIDDSLKKTPKDTTTRLDKLIKETLDEDFLDKKDAIIDTLNAKIAKERKNYPYNVRVFEEPSQLDFYDAITKSNFRTKTGPFFDYQKRKNKAGGGLLKQAGDRSGPPPESGPNSQGLQGLLNRVKKT